MGGNITPASHCLPWNAFVAPAFGQEQGQVLSDRRGGSPDMQQDRASHP